jgi:hypothetical protein
VLLLATCGFAQKYANHVTSIRVGIVILESAKQVSTQPGQSAAPFAWYNLDSATAIKPAGWTFVNPFAPTTVSPQEYARWQSLTPTATLPSVGDHVAKDDAAYWEVNLDNLSDQQLSQYDVLLVNPLYYIALTPFEKEMLEKFVDQGGILWIDAGYIGASTGGVNQVNGLPVSFVVQSGSGLTGQLSDFTQPLLTAPYQLTGGDVSILNDPGSTNNSNVLAPINLSSESAGAMYPISGSALADSLISEPVTLVGNSSASSATTQVARIGDGFVVVTARGISSKLNRPSNATTYSANSGYYAIEGKGGPTLGPDGIAAAKFAINLVSLTSEARQPGGGSRKASGTAMDLYAPLLNRFTIQANPYIPSAYNGAPVYYKGMMVVTSGDQVFVFDAHPANDLDNDGNPDDGVPDYSSLGTPWDLVWSSDHTGSALSSPSCAEVPNSSLATDMVYAVDMKGTLHCWNLLPRAANGSIIGSTAQNELYTINAPGGSATYDSHPFAPTVHEGVVYIADTVQGSTGLAVGRIWQVDARSGTILSSQAGNWYVGGTGDNLPDFTGSPVVGYIPVNDNSGAMDKVLYLPTKANTNNSTPCGIISFWIGTRGEAPVATPTVEGDLLAVTTRQNLRNGPIYLPTFGSSQIDAHAVKLTVTDSTGPWTANKLAQYFSGSVSLQQTGLLQFPFVNAGQANAFSTLLSNNSVTVSIDYTLDWGNSGSGVSDPTTVVTRGSFQFPDQQSPVRQVLGNLAMSPRGTIYASVADPGAALPIGTGGKSDGNYGGSLYGIRETAQNQFTCIFRYELYPKHTITLNQAGPSSYDEVLYDKDPVNQIVDSGQDWLTSSDRRLTNFVLTGAPSIRNGQVYVTAEAQKALDIQGFGRIPNAPVTILLAFNAEPTAPEIAVGQLPDGSTLIQPDFAKSSPLTLSIPDAQSSLSYSATATNGVTYDSDSGMLQIANLSALSTGNVQNVLSLSQPIILRRPGLPDTLIEPNNGPGPWSPLLWYQVFEGTETVPGVAPVVTGDSVFIGMSSTLPNVLNGLSFAFSGVVTGTAAQIPPNDPWLTAVDYADGSSGSYRSWQTQLWTLPYGGLQGAQTSDPYLLWPQTVGVTSFSQYVQRLNQTTLGKSTEVVGLAAGEGALGVLGDSGLYSFDKADFVVCDENRIAHFDPSGNALSTLQTSANAGAGGLSNSINVKGLVRVTKAYDLGNNNLLAIDSGGNRVVKLDAAGNESRAIGSFIIDPLHPVDGYRANESANGPEGDTLKSPEDALTYSSYVQQAQNPLTNAQPLEYWTHYVIADTGNHRLIELVDRFAADPNTRNIIGPVTAPAYVIDPTSHQTTTQNVPQVGVLWWHSPSIVSGRNFAFNSISRTYIPPTSQDNNNGRYIYVAGITNADVSNSSTTTSSNAGVGGFVIFDPNQAGYALVFNSVNGLPDLRNTSFFDVNTGIWDTNTALNASNLQINGNPINKPLINVSSVTAHLIPNYGGTPQIGIMIAAGDGLYEVVYNPSATYTQSPTLGLPVDWMLPGDVYTRLRHTGANGTDFGPNPLGFHPTYAKRLDNGDILFVNGYSGPHRDGTPCYGEVIELRGTTLGSGTYDGSGYTVGLPNLNFGTTSLVFTLPTVQGVRPLRLPTFADRR